MGTFLKCKLKLDVLFKRSAHSAGPSRKLDERKLEERKIEERKLDERKLGERKLDERKIEGAREGVR